MVDKLEIVIHHGGYWQKLHKMDYVGGKLTVFNDLPNCIDYAYVKTMVCSLGYNNVIKMHYLDPAISDFDNGIRFLDDDVSNFVSLLMEYGCIHLYLEHQYEIDLNGFNVNVPFM